MLWSLLVESIKPYWRHLVGVIVFQLAQSIANLYLPSLNADIIDNGVATGDIDYIWRMGGTMLGLSLLQIVCSIIAVYFAATLAMRVGRDLRGRLFAQVATFSESEVQRFGAPSLITRNTNDVQQVQMLALVSCTLLVSAPFMAIGGVFMAIQQDIVLSWILVVAVPLLLIAVSLIIWRMVPHFERMQKRIDVINRVLREQLSGIRVVRAFVRETEERDRFHEANKNVTESAYKAGRLMAMMFPLVNLILNVSSVAVLWFGASRVESGQMEVGALVAFLTYLIQILMAVMMATFMFVMVPRASVSADRIGEVLATSTTVVAPEDGIKNIADAGVIEFDDVTFAYPGAEEPVLRGVSFVARPGTTTAIIGSTGAGKSTLISLVPRLYDATSGTVRIGGIDVRDIDLETLWKTMGFVPQRPYLFSGTVASNLRYGEPHASEEHMWNTLAVAQAEDFVRAMPSELEATIAQGGTTVSGGQRQRLSIARAIVRQPQVLLFDDSFSALDTATDARLRAALDEYAAHATVIVVAQRVSSIVDADQILVLEDGAVAARGTHSELLESSATYQEIVSTQLRAEEAV